MYGLKYLTASVSSAYIYLQPVLVMIFAFLLSTFGIAEDYTGTITLEKIGYMLVIFLGVYSTSVSSFGKKSAKLKDN
jgi:drug/metabolite transporter (DMT)-like permease